MAKEHSILKAKKVIKASSDAKKKIASISNRIGVENLFPKKVELAKKAFQDIDTLPI